MTLSFESKMSIDSAWIFRICLVMAVTLILFADFLGYGGANAGKNDKSEDYEDYTAEDHSAKPDKGNCCRTLIVAYATEAPCSRKQIFSFNA